MPVSQTDAGARVDVTVPATQAQIGQTVTVPVIVYNHGPNTIDFLIGNVTPSPGAVFVGYTGCQLLSGITCRAYRITPGTSRTLGLRHFTATGATADPSARAEASASGGPVTLTGSSLGGSSLWVAATVLLALVAGAALLLVRRRRGGTTAET